MSVALFAMVVKEMLIIISQGLQYHCRNVLEIIIIFQKIRYKNLNRKGGGAQNVLLSGKFKQWLNIT